MRINGNLKVQISVEYNGWITTSQLNCNNFYIVTKEIEKIISMDDNTVSFKSLNIFHWLLFFLLVWEMYLFESNVLLFFENAYSIYILISSYT